jgi:hypothetical protein
MRLPDVLDDVRHAGPEAAFPTRKAEELGNLRAGEHEGNAALESEEDRLGDEVHDGAGLDRPRDDCHRADEQRQAHRQGGKAPGIAAGQVPDRGADQERDGRGRGDGSVPRTAECPEHEAAE